MTTPTAVPATPAELSAQRSITGSPVDGRRATTGGAARPRASAPTACARTPTAPPRARARNRRTRVSELLTLALLATATVAGCGGDPPPPAGATRAGTQVFAQASCGGCHTLAAADARGQVGPNLDKLRPDRERVASQVRDGGKGMPAYADRLSDREIQSVAAYVAEVAGRQ